MPRYGPGRRGVFPGRHTGSWIRIHAAGSGTMGLLEGFTFDHQSGGRRNVIAHLASGLRLKAAHTGHRVLFANAIAWVTRPTDAQDGSRLASRLNATS